MLKTQDVLVSESPWMEVIIYVKIIVNLPPWNIDVIIIIIIEAVFRPKTLKTEIKKDAKKKLRVGYVYTEKAFDTPCFMGR